MKTTADILIRLLKVIATPLILIFMVLLFTLLGLIIVVYGPIFYIFTGRNLLNEPVPEWLDI